MCSWAMCDCSDDAGVFTFDLAVLTKHHWRERGQLYTHTHALTHTHAHTALWTIHA